jgi:tetratricopeptide (TPR) repeat protein
MLNVFAPRLTTIAGQATVKTAGASLRFGKDKKEALPSNEALPSGDQVSFRQRQAAWEILNSVSDKEARADELIEDGKIQPALTLRQEAFAEYVALVGAQHESISEKRLMLGLWYMQAQQPTLAEAEFTAAITVAKIHAANKTKDTEVPRLYRQLADAYISQLQLPQAEEALKEALILYEASVGKDHQFIAVTKSELADVYAMQGNYEDAEWTYIEAIAGIKKHFGNDENLLLEVKDKLGMLYFSQGKHKLAASTFQSLREEMEAEYGRGSLESLTAQKKELMVMMEQENWPAAEGKLLDIITLSAKHFGKGDIETLESMNDLAVVYAQQEKIDQSHALLTEIRQGMKPLMAKHPEAALDVLVNLCRTYQMRPAGGEMAEVIWEEAQAHARRHRLPLPKTEDQLEE